MRRNSVEGSTQCKYGWLPMTTGASQSQAGLGLEINLVRRSRLKSQWPGLGWAKLI